MCGAEAALTPRTRPDAVALRRSFAAHRPPLRHAPRSHASPSWLRSHSRTARAEVIRNKGLQKITVDELVDEITPRGRATVPDEIKANMLLRIRRFLVAEREEAKEGSGAEGDAPSAAGAGAASLGAN